MPPRPRPGPRGPLLAPVLLPRAQFLATLRVEYEAPSEAALDLVLRLASAAQRQAIIDKQASFVFWIDQEWWTHVKNPHEYWTAAARRVLPDYHIAVNWIHKNQQCLRVVAW